MKWNCRLFQIDVIYCGTFSISSENAYICTNNVWRTWDVYRAQSLYQMNFPHTNTLTQWKTYASWNLLLSPSNRVMQRDDNNGFVSIIFEPNQFIYLAWKSYLDWIWDSFVTLYLLLLLIFIMCCQNSFNRKQKQWICWNRFIKMKKIRV